MNLLFVNSLAPACGVHQFGLNLFRVLAQSKMFTAHYCTPADNAGLGTAIISSNADFVLFNFYPCTMPWVSIHTLLFIRSLRLRAVSIFHEVPITGFDALLYPDPTFEFKSVRFTDWLPFGRPLPLALTGRRHAPPARRCPVVSTAGFGFGWKGHARVVRMVCEQFEKASVRVHLPFAAHGDADGAGAMAVAASCHEAAVGFPGINVTTDHEFMDSDKFVQWLGESDLNCFLYDDTNAGRGIASTADHALAARRPIALTRVTMFRHLWHIPEIFVENRRLPEIMDAGIEPLRPAYRQFSDAMVLAELERVIGVCRVMGLSGCGMNRLLTDGDREHLAPEIAEMAAAVPEMMGRKIAAANVQQAWMLRHVRRTGAQRILCVGCFEDTAFETLQAERAGGRSVAGIDPAVNQSLAEFAALSQQGWFDCIFATSVIEHVADDGAFLGQICALLAPDGVGLLTADYRSDWHPGDPLPATDERLYTPADIDRLSMILLAHGCYWVDQPNLCGAPDFHYQGHDYSFLALTFKKL